jgi:AcrR family transcriptional regulator
MAPLYGNILNELQCSLKNNTPHTGGLSIIRYTCMFIQMKKRKYNQRLRARKMEETRQEIAAAAARLHEEVGPAKTTIKAIAELSGVQRLTVYRHFPDEDSLLEACSSHWLAEHPLPVAEEYGGDSQLQAKKTLLAFYDYYAGTSAMWGSLYRDIDEVDALRKTMGGVETYLDSVSDQLVTSWNLKPAAKKRLSLTLRHCLRFATWRSLHDEGLTNKQVVQMVSRWITGAAS